MNLPALRQSWPRPTSPRPIVILGAGGIVRDAHLPAYAKAGLPVAGLFDLDRDRAAALAEQFGTTSYASLEEAVAVANCVFDIAAPPDAHEQILEALPPASTVLLQKPMGLDLDQATRIRRLCATRRHIAAVNFQLRFAPMMLAARDALEQGLLGSLLEIEVHINLLTPWHLFPHLAANRRVEIVSHSIHYLDAIRALAGDPKGVLARSFGHPASRLADTRTSAILDYGPELRVLLSINHHHGFGRRHQDAAFRIEGDKGAAVLNLGVLLDYPKGESDALALALDGNGWADLPLEGAWFPDAFVGPMSNLQRYAAGEDRHLETAVESAWSTMALVEACYEASVAAATPVRTVPS